jgi:hypothetical protein
VIEPGPRTLAGSITEYGADALLLVAAVVAAACSYSTTGRFFNQIAVAVGAVVLVAAVVGGWRAAFRPATVALVCVISVAVQLYKPPIGNVQRAGYFPVVLAVTAVATLAVAVVAVAPRGRHTDRILYAIMAVLGAAVLAIVVASGRPAIDVWQIFQQASAGLFHGRNPYQLSYTHIPAGQTAGCFNYLPATFLATWPGWAVLHDARYSEVAVLLAGWGVLARTLTRQAAGPRARTDALVLLAVAMSLTGTLRVGQQAWNESLLLGFLLIAACAALTGRTGWLVIGLGLALATKQHIGLLVPVMVMWPQLGWRRTAYSLGLAAVVSAPWVLWDPGRFKACTVDFFTHGIARFDSISLWHFVPAAIAPGVIVVALLASYVLVWRYLPRTCGGLLVGFALVLFAFDLFNKQSFENQWWFMAELLVCGLALSVAAGTGTGSADAGIRHAVAAA